MRRRGEGKTDWNMSHEEAMRRRHADPEAPRPYAGWEDTITVRLPEAKEQKPLSDGMQHQAFQIGLEFECGGRRWRCTDLGTRTVIAIPLEYPDDPNWYNGPPYAVAETVFDEYDLESCKPVEDDPEKQDVIGHEELRTFGDLEEGYLRDLPEEVDDYLAVLFDEYAQSGDTAALLSSLRIVSRVKGVSRIAEAAGMSRKGLQKVLSEEGNPEFARVNAIMHAMGYRLAPQKLDSSGHGNHTP